MNIWVDISNAPHVSFFKGFIKKWESQGHNVIVTARDLSGSLALLKANDIEYTEIGTHYGASKLNKVKGLIIRCLQLRRFLKSKSIDVAVSQSSFYSPIVAKMFGVRCVYTNDNEYAKGNVIANALATTVVYPAAMQELTSNSFFSKKFKYYPGVKEGIYLSLQKLNLKAKSQSIHIGIRPEPWTAQYHQRNDDSLLNFIRSLDSSVQITVLPRDLKQAAFFESLRFENVVVASKPLSISDIYDSFDVFVGAGGSMSRELAYLGLPCVSMYQGELLRVDRYLIDLGVMHHQVQPDKHLIETLIKCRQNEAFENVKSKLQKEGIIANMMITNTVLKQY